MKLVKGNEGFSLVDLLALVIAIGLIVFVVVLLLSFGEISKNNVIAEKIVNHEQISREEWDRYKDNEVYIDEKVAELKKKKITKIEKEKKESEIKEERNKEYQEYLNSLKTRDP